MRQIRIETNLARFLILKIKSVAFGGEAVGVIESAALLAKGPFGPPPLALAGKTCFVDAALASERVVASVTQEKRNFVRAKLVEVLDASPARVFPPCRYIDLCGGCQYQHVLYEEELKIKESQVREILERHAGISAKTVQPIRYSPKDYGYRNSVTLHRASLSGAKSGDLYFI